MSDPLQPFLPEPGAEEETATFTDGEGEATPLPPLSDSGLFPERYLPLEQVGSGGMGVVFSAYDRKLDRKVAIKWLRPELASTGSSQRRFLREATALARLSHPNVVTVFDVGRAGGRIYLAMELVPGVDLKTWLQQSSRSRRAVLDPFLQAAAGLAAIHEAGLVHRDFKAGNVMVRPDGRAQVVDFGLAGETGCGTEPGEEVLGPEELCRWHGKEGVAELTVAGSVLGTPAFMAPEQQRGEEVGPAADQYSFCVALTRALLAPESAGKAAPGRRMPARFQRILRRGLDQDPADRYPSMKALMGALRSARDAPRRRSLAAAGLLSIAALVSVGFWQPDRGALCRGAAEQLAGIWDDHRRSALEESLLGSGRSWAADVSRTTLATLDRYRDGWIRQHTEVCRATEVLGEQSQDLMDRRMDCLDQRRSELRALVDLLQADPEVAADRTVELASALSPLGGCEDTPALMAPLEVPSEEGTRQKLRLFRGRLAAAKIQEEAGRYEEACSEARAVLDQGGKLGYWPLTAEAWLRVGAAQERLSEAQEAEASLGKALLAAQAGHHDRVAAEAATALVRLSAYQQADLERGEFYAGVAAALLEPLWKVRELEASLADARGLLYFQSGNFAAAEQEHRRALALLREALGSDHPALASSLVRLSNVTAENGDLPAARRLLEEALAIHGRSFGADHPLTGTTHDRLGAVAFRAGDLDLAREQYSRALAIKRSTLGPEHRKVGVTLMHLGNVESREGNYSAAAELLHEALEILEGALGAEHPHTAVALGNLGAALADQGKGEEALAYHRRALEIHQGSFGSDHPWTANHHFNLGKASNDLRRFSEARRHLETAMGIWKDAFGEVHPLIAQGASELGRTLLGLGLEEEARASLERSLALQESTEPDPYLKAETRFRLALALEASGGEDRRAFDLAAAAGRDLEGLPGAAGDLRGEIGEWLQSRGNGFGPDP